MYLFNRTHIVYDRCKHEPHLFYAKNRMEALLYVAQKNKYSELPLLGGFLESRKPIIIDRLSAMDSRLSSLEANELSNLQMLALGVEVGAIKIDHLERFILKTDSDGYVYSLVEIAPENAILPN